MEKRLALVGSGGTEFMYTILDLTSWEALYAFKIQTETCYFDWNEPNSPSFIITTTSVYIAAIPKGSCADYVGIWMIRADHDS